MPKQPFPFHTHVYRLCCRDISESCLGCAKWALSGSEGDSERACANGNLLPDFIVKMSCKCAGFTAVHVVVPTNYIVISVSWERVGAGDVRQGLDKLCLTMLNVKAII